MFEKKKANRHNVFLHIEHEDVLKEIMELKNLGELKTVSKVVRFIILDYYEMLTEVENPRRKDIKLNAIGKDVSILLNMVCTMVANDPTLNSPSKHVRNDDVLLYWQEAYRYLESVMNERRSGYKKKLTPPPEIAEMLRTKYFDPTHLEQLENEKRDAEFEMLFSMPPPKLP